VADIIRQHGKDFIESNRSRLTWRQLKVIRAIEHCRTAVKSWSSERVHRWDRISAKKPAKPLDSQSLTPGFSRKQIEPVFLRDPLKRSGCIIAGSRGS
jgi:hypothetical protein